MGWGQRDGYIFQSLIPESSLKSVDWFHSKLPRDWGSGGILTFVSPFCLTVGVCNTDNFSLLSITIDYGPFGFMDSYDPSECITYGGFVCLFGFGGCLGLFGFFLFT